MVALLLQQQQLSFFHSYAVSRRRPYVIPIPPRDKGRTFTIIIIVIGRRGGGGGGSDAR